MPHLGGFIVDHQPIFFTNKLIRLTQDNSIEPLSCLFGQNQFSFINFTIKPELSQYEARKVL